MYEFQCSLVHHSWHTHTHTHTHTHRNRTHPKAVRSWSHRVKHLLALCPTAGNSTLTHPPPPPALFLFALPIYSSFIPFIHLTFIGSLSPSHACLLLSAPPFCCFVCFFSPFGFSRLLPFVIFLLLPPSVRCLLCSRVVFEVPSSSHFPFFPPFLPSPASILLCSLISLFTRTLSFHKHTELEPNQNENASFNHLDRKEMPSGVNFMNFLYLLTLLCNSRCCCVCFHCIILCTSAI